MRPFVFLALAFAMTTSCSAQPSCYTVRTGVVLPDSKKVLGHVTNGASGRNIAEAVLSGKIDEVRRQLASDPKLLTTQVPPAKPGIAAPEGQYGDLLTFAVARCNADMVQALLQAGMPADGVQPGRALSLAILADTPDMAEILLSSGASADPQKIGGVNAMREALAFNNLGGIMTLIRHGADMSWADAQGVAHIQTAINMERYQAAEHMVKAGASLWQMTGAGALPAHGLSLEPVMKDKNEAIARERLIARVKQESGSWPPPAPVQVRNMVLAGKWPPENLEDANLPPISDAALSDMKARFGTVN